MENVEFEPTPGRMVLTDTLRAILETYNILYEADEYGTVPYNALIYGIASSRGEAPPIIYEEDQED